jgi:hypothetical protein
MGIIIMTARGVRHPHRQKGRGQHEAQQDALRAGAHEGDDGQGDAPVQVPFLHGGGDEEATQKQKDDVVAIGRGDSGIAQCAGDRQQEDRQQ